MTALAAPLEADLTPSCDALDAAVEHVRRRRCEAGAEMPTDTQPDITGKVRAHTRQLQYVSRVGTTPRRWDARLLRERHQRAAQIPGAGENWAAVGEIQWPPGGETDDR